MQVSNERCEKSGLKQLDIIRLLVGLVDLYREWNIQLDSTYIENLLTILTRRFACCIANCNVNRFQPLHSLEK